MEIEVERREGGGRIYRAGPVNIHGYLMKGPLLQSISN